MNRVIWQFDRAVAVRAVVDVGGQGRVSEKVGVCIRAVELVQDTERIFEIELVVYNITNTVEVRKVSGRLFWSAKVHKGDI